MPNEPLLTISLSRRGEEFQAELQAPSELNGVADLRITHTGANALAVIQDCLAELQDRASEGDKIALRFS